MASIPDALPPAAAPIERAARAESSSQSAPQVRGPLGSFENRRAPRIPRQSSAQLIHWPGSPRLAPLDVTVVDYSDTGLGVLHREAVLVGSLFIVREPFITAGSTCMYTVRRCDRRADGMHSIGLEKYNSLTDDLEPKEDHVVPPSKWMRWLFFAFALIGAAQVVTMAMTRWGQ